MNDHCTSRLTATLFSQIFFLCGHIYYMLSSPLCCSSVFKDTQVKKLRSRTSGGSETTACHLGNTD